MLATVVTGGNPALLADKRDVFKLGANWQPFKNTDLRFRADYVHSKIDHPIQGIYGPTPALEAAFPDRFVRQEVCDDEGTCTNQLVSADLRPVNFDSATRETLRIGFDFSKPLKSKRPSQSTMDALRSQFRAAFGAGGRTPQPGQQAQPAPAQGQAPQGQQPQGQQAQPQGTPAAGAPPPPPAQGASPRGGGNSGGVAPLAVAAARGAGEAAASSAAAAAAASISR